MGQNLNIIIIIIIALCLLKCCPIMLCMFFNIVDHAQMNLLLQIIPSKNKIYLQARKLVHRVHVNCKRLKQLTDEPVVILGETVRHPTHLWTLC